MHPARTIQFDDLYNSLQHAYEAGMVYRQVDGDLELYCYSDETVYERKWNDWTLLARGLILDVVNKKVVATPFPKFFNVEEVGIATLPNLPFEVFDKLDGSLIIIFHYNGKWRCATKGSFKSEQALWAEGWLHKNIALQHMNTGTTFLAEVIYPQNRIVVDYKGKQGLVLLGGYMESGEELSYSALNNCDILGWEVVARHSYDSISELLVKSSGLSCNEEGWVVRFNDGTRVKIKGAEYCRVHRLVSNLTPLSIWRNMEAEEDLEKIRESLPEEFWGDFDTICDLLVDLVNAVLRRVAEAASNVSSLTDKEVGLRLGEFTADVRRFIFPYRKGSLLEGRARHSVFEAIRPSGNKLEGYNASSSVVRVQNDI